MMRIVCIVLFIGGLATGVIWPWAQRHFGGEEIGTWSLYQRGSGYQTAHIALKDSDAPLRIFVDARPLDGVTNTQSASVLNLAVSRDNMPVQADRLHYTLTSGSSQRDVPQNNVVIRQDAKDMEVVKAGNYDFSVRLAEDGLSLKSADLVLRRGAQPVDENITTFGVLAMVAGLYGFMRLRRRKMQQ